MERMILSIYERKQHPTIKTQYLLNKDEKPTVQNLRNALYKLDLSGLLVFCLDADLSKLFKEDYSFNDHGIYYDVFRNSNFDFHVHELEEKAKKLQTKQKKKFRQEIEVQLKEVNSQLDYWRQQLAFTLVPCEQSTQKRDWQRFMEYEKFVDPVDQYTLNPYFTEDYHTHYILDIETTSLDFDTGEITLLGIKPVGEKHYSILQNPKPNDLRKLFEFIEGSTVIGHNLVFDLSWLMAKAGIEFAPNIQTVDTMLLAHVAGERQLSLKHLSMMYGNFKGRRNTLTADESYLVEDLLSTECLYNKFKDQLSTFAGQLVCNAVKTFAEAKVNGVVLDQHRLFEVRDLYKQFDTPKYAFNVNSDREVGKYLIEQGVPLTAKTEKGQLKVNKGTLENFRHFEAVDGYLDYMQELTIYDKFVKPYCTLQSFTIRPNIMLFGTETGRLSCSDPNVQQIPKRSYFKDIFRSRFGSDGVIGSIDLDQAELRIAAMLSGDGVYAKALLSRDFHSYIGSQSFEKPIEAVTEEERHAAKTVNFGGVLYGGSAAGIAFRIGVDVSIVKRIQDYYAKEFTKLTEWIEGQKNLAFKTKQVQTYFGRVRPLDGFNWGETRRRGVNTAVQSVASDVMLYLCVRLSSYFRKYQLKSRILFSVHDEMVIDIYRSEFDQVTQLLKQSFKDVLRTPLGKLELANSLPISGTLQYGKSWMYAKSKSFEPEGKVKISSLE